MALLEDEMEWFEIEILITNNRDRIVGNRVFIDFEKAREYLRMKETQLAKDCPHDEGERKGGH